MNEVKIITDCSTETFRDIVHPARQPVVLRGLDVGPCVDRWKDVKGYLIPKSANRPVKVHETKQKAMDFRSKNFSYKVMDFHELLLNAHDDSNPLGYYLRDVGDDPRGRKVVDFRQDFPDLAEDLKDLDLFDGSRFFSSVLRVSSPGIQLWTHYDVMDNIYLQIVGHKRAILWPPNEAFKLYLDGDKSKVVDVDNPDLEQFPEFPNAQRYEVSLQPGDVLFIPAFWFHNMTALDFGMAVNTFWKNLDPSLYDKKDPYANRDLLPSAKAMRMLDNVIRQLDELPEDVRDFYGRQLMSRLDKKLLTHK